MAAAGGRKERRERRESRERESRMRDGDEDGGGGSGQYGQGEIDAARRRDLAGRDEDKGKQSSARERHDDGRAVGGAILREKTQDEGSRLDGEPLKRLTVAPESATRLGGQQQPPPPPPKKLIVVPPLTPYKPLGAMAQGDASSSKTPRQDGGVARQIKAQLSPEAGPSKSTMVKPVLGQIGGTSARAPKRDLHEPRLRASGSPLASATKKARIHEEKAESVPHDLFDAFAKVTAEKYADALALDQFAVLHPETQRPFSSWYDAVNRLLPYHVAAIPERSTEEMIGKRWHAKEKANAAKVGRRIDTLQGRVSRVLEKSRANNERRVRDEYIWDLCLLQQEKETLKAEQERHRSLVSDFTRTSRQVDTLKTELHAKQSHNAVQEGSNPGLDNARENESLGLPDHSKTAILARAEAMVKQSQGSSSQTKAVSPTKEAVAPTRRQATKTTSTTPPAFPTIKLTQELVELIHTKFGVVPTDWTMPRVAPQAMNHQFQQSTTLGCVQDPGRWPKLCAQGWQPWIDLGTLSPIKVVSIAQELERVFRAKSDRSESAAAVATPTAGKSDAGIRVVDANPKVKK